MRNLLLPAAFGKLPDLKNNMDLYFEFRRIIQGLCFGFASQSDPLPEGFHINCHILTRALVKFFPSLEVETGRFTTIWTLARGRGCDHSWLRLSPDWVIDVYPVYAFMGPLFVWVHEDGPWAGMYLEYRDDQLQGVIDDPNTERSIEIVSRAIEQQLIKSH